MTFDDLHQLYEQRTMLQERQLTFERNVTQVVARMSPGEHKPFEDLVLESRKTIEVLGVGRHSDPSLSAAVIDRDGQTLQKGLRFAAQKLDHLEQEFSALRRAQK
jgi:hypothetical protein